MFSDPHTQSLRTPNAPAKILGFVLCMLVLEPFAAAQDAVNPCEILTETLDCTAPGLHGAEIDFKTIKLNGKRKNNPKASVGEALIIKTGIKYTKRAKAEITTTFNGGCPPRIETKRTKPEVNVTYSATLDGSSYSGNGTEFSLTAPLAIGSYPLVVTYTATAVGGCIDNAPLSETKTFVLEVIDGAYILNLTAVKSGTAITVPEGTYLCKDQGQELDLTVAFSEPLSSLPFNSNQITWTVTPTQAGTFSGPNGATGDSVTWKQADDFVSTTVDDLEITVNAPDMQPRSFYLTVFGVNSTSGILAVNTTQTFAIENTDISPMDADKSIIVAALGGITDVGTGTATKLRTRTFSGTSPFNLLESEAFLPAEADQTNPALQIVKKATFFQSGDTLMVEIEAGPVAGDVNITWEQDRPGGTRQILHREHMEVTESPGPQTVKIVVDGTTNEGPHYLLKGSDIDLRAIPTPLGFAAGYPKWSISHNLPGTISPPDDGIDLFEFDNLEPGEYKITAKVGTKNSQKTTFKLYVVHVDLDVDTNRNNVVEDVDDTNEDLWNATSGAIFAVNYDDDIVGSGTRSDSIEFRKNGKPYHEDFEINGPMDLDDIAPIVIQKVGATEGVQYFLRMDAAQLKGVHIFSEKSADAKTIRKGLQRWSGWGPNKNDTGLIDFEITHIVKKQAQLTMGIEGLFFPGATVYDHWGPGSNWTFDGTIDLELIAQKDTGGSSIIPANELSRDKIRMRVAPYLLLPNTQPALDIFLANYPEAGDLDTKFGTFSRPTPPSETQWFQDHVQIGQTSFPGSTSHITLRMPYGGQDDWPKNRLLKKDLGLMRVRDFLDHPPSAPAGGFGSGEFGGNLELIPHSPDWPLGRIIYGNIMSAELKSFFKGQKAGGTLAVQEPIELPTGWLRVGHVDEYVGFVKGGPRGYKVVHGDPDLAYKLLNSGEFGIPAPNAKAPLFAKGTHVFGQATDLVNPSDADYLFDGAAHGLITVTNHSAFTDGKILTIEDGIHTVVFEFDNDSSVTSGHVAVSVSGVANAGIMRDRLSTKIDQEIGLGNLDLIMKKDGPSSILLIHQQVTSAGNKTITSNVSTASGITMIGMAGGEDPGPGDGDGRDFSALDGSDTFQWIRLIGGTGRGQVALVEDYGNGWVQIADMGSTVYDTTSYLIWNLGAGFTGLYQYTSGNAYIPTSSSWFTPPDATTEYVMVSDCHYWDAHIMGVGKSDIPAVFSVQEYLIEAAPGEEMDLFGDEIQTIISGAMSAIQTGMGSDGGGLYLKRESNTSDDSLLGDSDDDFLSVPIIFFGARNDPLNLLMQGSVSGAVPRHALAYTPGLANFQPATMDHVVFPKPFMPKVNVVISGSPTEKDIFERAVEHVLSHGAEGRVRFADDWDLYHRLDGEVHCGTAARREHFSTPWWEQLP